MTTEKQRMTGKIRSMLSIGAMMGMAEAATVPYTDVPHFRYRNRSVNHKATHLPTRRKRNKIARRSRRFNLKRA